MKNREKVPLWLRTPPLTTRERISLKLLHKLDHLRDKIRDHTTFLVLGSREDRILHALYHVFESSDPLMVSASQLEQVSKYGFKFGAFFLNYEFTMTYGGVSNMGSKGFSIVRLDEERPLKHLQIDGLISYEKIDIVTPPGHALKITVTVDGAKRSRRLHTRWGRLGLYYEENKSGPLFAALTAMVALMGVLIGHYWKPR